MSFTYKQILTKAQECKKSVETEYKVGINTKNAYYFAKLITNPKLKTVTHKEMDYAPNPTGDYISNQIYKEDYIKICKYLINFVEQKSRLPNFLEWKSKKIRVRDYTYLFARILLYYNTNKQYPKYANINTKAWEKPTEKHNEVYEYFVKKFGKITCIDDALEKIAGRGYGYYYDDQYSNKQSIDRMKQGLGVNCTDSMHVFYNIMLEFIKQGKYKKVECLHVRCSGGDGHVRMRVTKNDGTTFLRDPAAVLDSGSITHNWCVNNYTLLGIDSTWFMQNLHR